MSFDCMSCTQGFSKIWDLETHLFHDHEMKEAKPANKTNFNLKQEQNPSQRALLIDDVTNEIKHKGLNDQSKEVCERDLYQVASTKSHTQGSEHLKHVREEHFGSDVYGNSLAQTAFAAGNNLLNADKNPHQIYAFHRNFSGTDKLKNDISRKNDIKKEIKPANVTSCNLKQGCSPSQRAVLFNNNTNEIKQKKVTVKSKELCERDLHQEASTNLTHAGEEPFQDNMISDKFAKTASVLGHDSLNSSKNANDFKNDTSSDVSEKPHQCDVCQRRFALPHNLRTHKARHSGEKPHQCTVCDKRFAVTTGLKTHMLIHTGEKPHQCEYCPKRFSQRSSLKTHELRHTGERPHACPVCEKSFYLASHLREHMSIHSGEKPHQCHICQKMFARPGFLQRHMVRHQGQKRYQCDICHKKFTQSGSLSTHKLLHTGEKPHKCDICQKTFAQSNSLRVHKLLHSGEKPHQCDICQKRFSLPGSLKSHQVIHSAEKQHQCDICQKKFTRPRDVKRHVNVMHTRQTPHQ